MAHHQHARTSSKRKTWRYFRKRLRQHLNKDLRKNPDGAVKHGAVALIHKASHTSYDPY